MKATIASIALIALFIAPISAFANGRVPVISLSPKNDTIIFATHAWRPLLASGLFTGFSYGTNGFPVSGGDPIMVQTTSIDSDGDTHSSSIKATTYANGQFFLPINFSKCYPVIKTGAHYISSCWFTVTDLATGATTSSMVAFK